MDLNECINWFGNTTNRKVECQGSKTNEIRITEVTFIKTPPYIIVYIDRLMQDYEQQWDSFKSMNDFEITLYNNRKIKYEIIQVIRHHGAHWTFANKVTNNQWNLIDDSKISTNVTLAKVFEMLQIVIARKISN